MLERLKTSLCKSAGGPLPPEVLRKKKKRVRLLRVQKPQQRLQPQPRLEAHTNTNTGRARNHNSAVTKVQEPAWRSPCGADNSHSASCWCPRERELKSGATAVLQTRVCPTAQGVTAAAAASQDTTGRPAALPPSCSGSSVSRLRSARGEAAALQPVPFTRHAAPAARQKRANLPPVHFLPPFLG